MITAVLAAMVLFTDTAVAAQSAANPPPVSPAEVTAPAKPKADPNAMICRSEPVLGSRMPVKRCHTQAQADTQKFEDRQLLERAQIRPDPGH